MSEVPPPKPPPGGFPFAARPAAPQEPPAAPATPPPPPPAAPTQGQQGFQQLSVAQFRAAQAAGTPPAQPPSSSPSAPPASSTPVVKQGQLGSVVIPPWEAPLPGRETRPSGTDQSHPPDSDDAYAAPRMAAPPKDPWFDRGHVALLIASVLLTVLTFVELVVVGFKIGYQNARESAEAAQEAQQAEVDRATTERREQGAGARSESLYPTNRYSNRTSPENEIDRVQRENERREMMDSYAREREDETSVPRTGDPSGEADTNTVPAPATEEPASSSGGGFEMATPVPE